LGQFSGHEGPVVSLAFSPDGGRLLSGSIDNTVRLWDVDGGREIRRFDGHNGGIFSLDFSPDGQYFASGSPDASVIIWQTESGELLRRLDDLDGSVSGVAFDPGGERLWAAAGSQVRSWTPILDLDHLLEWTQANRYVRDLTCSEQELYQVGEGCETN
jgi:WD40 repeat protein